MKIQFKILFVAVIFVCSFLCIDQAKADGVLTLIDAGTGMNRTVTVESAGQFRLVFEATYNYGISKWYDLVNDPSATLDILQNSTGYVPIHEQGSLFNQVYYPVDYIGHIIGASLNLNANLPRSIRIVGNTPGRVIIENLFIPCISDSRNNPNFQSQERYTIYPDGKIYVTFTLTTPVADASSRWCTFLNFGDPSYGGTGDDGGASGSHDSTLVDNTKHWAVNRWAGYMLVRTNGTYWKIISNTESTLTVDGIGGTALDGTYSIHPGGTAAGSHGLILVDNTQNWSIDQWAGYQLTQPGYHYWNIVSNTANTLTVDKVGSGLIDTYYTIGSRIDKYGWIRSTDMQDPYVYSTEKPRYVFAYWDKTTPALWSDWTKASILFVQDPKNDPYLGSQFVTHAWRGSKRLGYDLGQRDFTAGQVITLNYFVRLGTENSVILPDIKNRAAAGPIADAYIADPIPPGGSNNDTTPPSVPANLAGTAVSHIAINLTWSASTDNVGVAGYQIYRNGTQIATSTTNSYSDTGLAASTQYTYTVAAHDSAGNVSVQCAAVNVTTSVQTPALSVLDTGSGLNQIVWVESAGQFKIGFFAQWNFGIAGWYDLVNDPAKNIEQFYDYPLFNQDLWHGDEHCVNYIKLWGSYLTSWEFPPNGGIHVLENTPGKVVIESKTYAAPTAGTCVPFKDRTVTSRYEIYPNGRILISTILHTDSAVTARTLKAWVGLSDPTYILRASGTAAASGKILTDATKNWTPNEWAGCQIDYANRDRTSLVGSNTETTLTLNDAAYSGDYEIRNKYGWIQASSQSNPMFLGWGPNVPYLYMYWDPNTPIPFDDYTKASILIARHPDDQYQGNATVPSGWLARHGWSNTYGWKYPYWDNTVTVAANTDMYFHFLVQLGTKNSSVLPDINNKTIADALTAQFLSTSTPADTTPPTGSVNINSGATYTKSPSAILTLFAQDLSGVVQMKLSDRNDNFSSLTALAFASPYPWNLLGSDGIKNIYAWFKDAFNNWMTAPVSDTITLDTLAPTISNVATANISNNSALITFTSSEPTVDYLNYGLSVSYTSQTIEETSYNTSHSINLSSLSASTTYNYQIVITDRASNQSQSINYTFKTLAASAPDNISPSAVSSLSAGSISSTGAILSWTAVGDDANIGLASNYDIRYSTSNPGSSISTWWTSAAQISGEPAPHLAGTAETLIITGLSPSTQYYFALKTNDEVPNTSAISNLPSFTTTAAPIVLPPPTPSGGGGSSGGGGGGASTPATPAVNVSPSNFVALGANNQILLSWQNPLTSNFARVKLYRKLGSYPTSETDAQAKMIYEGANQQFIDTNLENNQTYFYHLYAYDRSSNRSAPLLAYTKTDASKETVAMPKTESPLLNKEGTGVVSNSQETSGSGSGQTKRSLIGVKSAEADQITRAESIQLKAQARSVNLSAITKKIYDKIILLAEKTPTQDNRYNLASFIHNGTPTTIINGAGERGGSIASFRSAFNRLPESETDWQDVIKIANGRWPTQRNLSAEQRAQTDIFVKIYGRTANLKNQNDNAAVTVITYGLRPALRNTESEKAAIRSFRYIFNSAPSTALDWDVVRAIAYSGAKR